jgi:hypothetical protein
MCRLEDEADEKGNGGQTKRLRFALLHYVALLCGGEDQGGDEAKRQRRLWQEGRVPTPAVTPDRRYRWGTREVRSSS